MASQVVVRVVQDTVCIGSTVAEGVDADAAKPTGGPGRKHRGNLYGVQQSCALKFQGLAQGVD